MDGERVVEIAVRLIGHDLDNPEFELTLASFCEALNDAILLEEMGAPDWAIEQALRQQRG